VCIPAYRCTAKALGSLSEFFQPGRIFLLTACQAHVTMRIMQSGAWQLRDWMTRRGLLQNEAAEALGFHEAFISQLVNGRRSPGLNNALKIERVTGIPVSAWASTRLDKPESLVAANTRKRTA
jgi:plasmid maintenance system antidote protein VapI